MPHDVTRRDVLNGAASMIAASLAPLDELHAQVAQQSFEQWVQTFRARARARGVSEAT